jgi:poly(3-hydroxybutyrate) depolymerase
VCLITIMTLTGLVVSSAPARAAFAQSASNVSIAVSHEPAHAISAMAFAETPGVICGVSGGGCP